MSREIIKWPRVEHDLAEHFAYIAQDKIEPAERLLSVAEKSFDRLSLMPSMGAAWKSRRPHLQGIHFYPMPAPYRSYIIFYRFTRDRIEFLAVLHGARNLARRLGEWLR